MADAIRRFEPQAADDDRDADIAPVRSASPLDAIRAELAAEVEQNDITLEVPGRPGYAVRYATKLSYEQLMGWRKRAVDKAMPLGVDELRLAALVCANQCRAILRHGEEITTDGAPLTFASPQFHELLEVGRSTDAVRQFYGRDFDVAAASNRILDAAGMGETAEDAEEGPDPTQS